MSEFPCKRCYEHPSQPGHYGCSLCDIEMVRNMWPAYYGGYTASLDGTPEKHTDRTNPYPPGSFARSEWDRGWRDAILDMMRYETI